MKLEGYSGTMCNKHVHSTVTSMTRNGEPTTRRAYFKKFISPVQAAKHKDTITKKENHDRLD